MRTFREPTLRKLLTPPLVLGVPFLPLTGVAGATVLVALILQDWKWGQVSALAVGSSSYGVLRLISRFAQPGWEETAVFLFEWIFASPRKCHRTVLGKMESGLLPLAPETLGEREILAHSERLLEDLERLAIDEEQIIQAAWSDEGLILGQIQVQGEGLFTTRMP